MKREERDLCRLQTSFLSRMRSGFLNNQWRFCHVRNNPENRFEFEREQLLNLNAGSNFKRTNQSWGWNDLASSRCCKSLWGKPKRRILRHIFHSSRVFRPPKHTYLELNLLGFIRSLALWNCWFYCDSGLFFLRKGICGLTSGQRWMEWFPCWQRSLTTRQT